MAHAWIRVDIDHTPDADRSRRRAAARRPAAWSRTAAFAVPRMAASCRCESASDCRRRGMDDDAVARADGGRSLPPSSSPPSTLRIDRAVSDFRIDRAVPLRRLLLLPSPSPPSRMRRLEGMVASVC